MATELRRTSIARLSTDGDNKGARVVAVCVEIKFYGAFVLNRRAVFHAIDATPAR